MVSTLNRIVNIASANLNKRAILLKLMLSAQGQICDERESQKSFIEKCLGFNLLVSITFLSEQT